ncbi:hypothetical protein BT96DRAFT_265825 [Gymnopus androsaceus JB14]|uniref:Uncharacterized protein n=1 Tax=Gymnopus androsaceus JB14 TaxID=1447944 RepID=A0A6A4H393_9AGAR|nr:hypothetical protein BT96DRAFT_265825 [Gymnopus androsaceus JB14]
MSSYKPKALSYPDAIRVFNDDDVLAGLKEACQKLSESGNALLKTFESISNQLHTFDIQSVATIEPLTPRWAVYQKDFSEIVRQHKANAAIISGRLKMFCTVILPLTLQNSESRCYREIAQILQSFMNISSDTMSNTRKLVETQLKLNNDLTSFHTEFVKIAHLKADEQKELEDLDPQFSQLEKTIRQIYLVNGQMTEPDVTLLAFSALRMSSPRRTKLSHRQLMLPGPALSEMNRLYEDLEQTQNEIAHVLYNSQVCHRQTDITTMTRIAISTLVKEESLTTEPILTFFVSIWARLQADCLDILRWLQDEREPSCTPFCIKAYVDSGHTLYLSVADALDVYFSEEISPLAKASMTQKLERT